MSTIKHPIKHSCSFIKLQINMVCKFHVSMYGDDLTYNRFEHPFIAPSEPKACQDAKARNVRKVLCVKYITNFYLIIGRKGEGNPSVTTGIPFLQNAQWVWVDVVVAKARPFSLSAPIDEGHQVFSLRKLLKLLSHEQLPTGRVRINCRMVEMFGQRSSLQIETASGNDLMLDLSRFETFQRLTSCSNEVGIGRSSANSFCSFSKMACVRFSTLLGTSIVPRRAPPIETGNLLFMWAMIWSRNGQQ